MNRVHFDFTPVGDGALCGAEDVFVTHDQDFVDCVGCRRILLLASLRPAS